MRFEHHVGLTTNFLIEVESGVFDVNRYGRYFAMYGEHIGYGVDGHVYCVHTYTNDPMNISDIEEQYDKRKAKHCLIAQARLEQRLEVDRIEHSMTRLKVSQ